MNLKRKILNLEKEPCNNVCGETEIQSGGHDPFVKKIMMLLSKQVARLELDVEMHVTENANLKLDETNKLVTFITIGMWSLAIVYMLSCVWLDAYGSNVSTYS